MRYALKRTITGMQKSMIAQHGDVVWVEICDLFPDSFTVASVVATLPYLQNFAPRTAQDLARVVLANVIAQYDDNPSECPIIRRGRLYVWR